MNKELAKRLKKITPTEGGVDVSFNLQNSGQPGKVASTLILKVFEKTEKGMIISASITIPAVAETVAQANTSALEDALTLLGV
jgi:hypothetical protein